MDTGTIKDVLKDNLINLDLHARNKDEVIKKLSKKLFDEGYVADLEAFIEDVYLRESEGITGMGNNVAIPHGKSHGVKTAGVAIGRTKGMIEWESYDKQPARLFFLFAVPKGKEGAEVHLKLLSQIATKLANVEVLDKLKNVKEITEFKKILL